MKRLVNSMALAAAAVAALVGCAKETVSEQASSSGKFVDVKFTAEIPAYQTTKSTVDVNGLTFNTRWADGDKMGLSYAYGESTPKTEGENIQATYSKDGSYTVKLPEYKGAWEYYVYYPYQTAITSSKSVEIPFGAERTQNGNSINSDYDLMQAIHAVTNGMEGKDDDGSSIQFEMERLTSLLYFHFTSSLTETVQKATLTVDGDPIAAEKLALYVDMTNYATSYVSGSTSNSIVLNLTDVTADDFMLWFNILPYVSTSQGIKNIKLVVETETKTFSITNPNSELDLYKAGQVHSINLNIPDSAWKDKETPAPPVTTPVYEKVTSALTDWSGDYLIVYENDVVAFDGSLALDKIDSGNNVRSITITNEKVEATDDVDAISFTIASVDNGYSIQSASGVFIGSVGTTKFNKSTTESYSHTITYDEQAGVKIKGEGSLYLRFNSASGDSNYRFRYYSSSSQKSIALYKRSESLPKAPFITLTPESGSVAADATSASFAVKSNVDWTVSTDASWVTLGTTSGSNDGTVALSFTANAGAADRTATVMVGSADATISRTYTLVQKKVGGSEKTETISGTFTSSNSELSLITTSGITLVQAKGSGNAVGGSYNTPSTLRIYKGNTLTFSGKAITKIEIVVKGKYYGNSLTANLGTLTPTTTSGGTIIWEGESNSVTITNVAKTDNVQLRPASIRVTYLE